MPWRLRWSVRQDGAVAWMIPDAAFVLKEARGEAKFFVLEVDRGTMPITRTRRGQSSFQRKIELYKETRSQGALWCRFGIPAFRVLVVAESAHRLASIRRAAARLFKRGDSEMFLFAVAADLLHGKPLDKWLTCGGMSRRLLAQADRLSTARAENAEVS